VFKYKILSEYKYNMINFIGSKFFHDKMVFHVASCRSEVYLYKGYWICCTSVLQIAIVTLFSC